MSTTAISTSTKMSANASTTSTNEKRKSQCKRKPPPSSATLVDLELGDTPDDRYPPFDIDDPFASLTELRRRRSHSCSYVLQHAGDDTADLHHQATDTAPFDPPPLSPKAFPSQIQRRYTLTVALPSPPSLSAADTPSPALPDGRDVEAQREDALSKLTKSATDSKEKKPVDTDTVSNRSRDGSAGRKSHQEHHRRYTHISMLFRQSSPVQTPQNGRPKPTHTKSHYIPRKASTLSYMYTPPLTPDVSGSSSSSSSLFDPSMLPPPKGEDDAIPPPPKSPTPSTHSFVKKLLTKRSLGILPPLPRRKENLDAKELPSLPPSPSRGAKREAENDSSGVPFPRSQAQASLSDVTLPTTGYYEKPKTTLSIIGASPQPPAFSRLSPPERESDGNATAPERRSPPGAELDAGLAPPRKHKLFSFSSRSLLRTKVDLYDNVVDETGRKVHLPESPRAEFDEFAIPSPMQLLRAASLSVISESGVRVRFGELWENQKTAFIFIRHFRATACQDYVRSIASEVDVEALEKAGLRIVIVGMGSPSLIAPYRQLTGTSLPIYTDPTLALHHALGMTLRSSERGPASERGQYSVSRGGAFAFDNLRRTIVGATRLPIFERAGDTAQLGGEFILGPSVSECSYARRMRTTRSHVPILDVIAATGIKPPKKRRARRGMRLRLLGGALRGSENDYEGVRRSSMDDEDAWMAKRRRSLVRMNKKRQQRRAGPLIYARDEGARYASEPGADSDDAARTLVNVRSPHNGRVSVVEEEEDEGLDETHDSAIPPGHN